MNHAQSHGSHSAPHDEDTIAALATPPGTSGIAVIRVSGTASIPSTAEVFDGAVDLRNALTHSIHHGTIRDEHNDILDEVLVSLFRSPHSYTGEDSVEVSCHGGIAVSNAILRRFFSLGVRQAEPGEFTRRAFLNGKIDLAQSEAVADLIHAQSESARRASVEQLHGTLSKYITGIREQLVHCASLLELSLDFAEEDVELLPAEELHRELSQAHARMMEALESYNTGRVIRDGLRVTIAGAPNVGKSSLLNRFLGTARAIVTDIPGTTRDYLEEQIILNGSIIRFIDTAGLRSTDDIVEREGIRLTNELLTSSDVVLYLMDATSDTHVDAERVLLSIPGLDRGKMLFVWNKIDVQKPPDRSNPDSTTFCISALDGTGIDALSAHLNRIAMNSSKTTERSRVLVTNLRHAECLRRGVAAVDRAFDAMAAKRTEEILAFEIRAAIDAMGEIIGAVTSDDILNSIFSRFCIGK